MRLSLYRHALAFVLALPPSGGALAHEPDLDTRIREYLLQHPEVIVEAMEVLAAREAQAVAQAKLAAFPDLFARPPELGLGDPDAPIRVVEFFDYRCVPCKAVHPELEALVAEHPDLRIEMRHLPILSPGSERAARFALAVRDTYGLEAYAKVHKELWTLRGPLNSAGFERIATALGLDFATLEPAMETDAVDALIAHNRDFAIEMEIRGTPAFASQTSVTFGASGIGALAETWLTQ